MLSFITIVALGFSINVVLPGFTRDVLDAGKSGFGIMFGFNAVGALLASTLVASHGSSSRAWSMLLFLGVAFGAAQAVTGLMPSFWLAVATMFAAGAFGGGFQTLIMARIFHLAEPAYLGRVTALTSGGWSLTNLVGLAVGGFADIAGERAVLVAAGVGLIVLTVALSLWTRTSASPAREASLRA
jgi:predicted MFS family arabinose efflux permease